MRILFLGAMAVTTACSSGSKAADRPTTPSTTNVTTAVQGLLQHGIQQANSNMISQAVTTFNDVLLLSPNNTYALYNLGLIDQNRNDPTGAVTYYDRALNADGTYTPAMYNKAIILEVTDSQAALALYQRIVALDPKASTAYLRMAFVYAREGQHAQASAARAKAVALDPGLSKYPLP
jgi:tetratricopeptide (TPR) repeat protein